MVKLASGQRGRRGSCFKHAKLGVQKALAYAYRDRRQKKRQMRTLWIARVNAAARLCGISYSKLIQGLAKAKIATNRKALADIAVRDPQAFQAIVTQAQAALG